MVRDNPGTHLDEATFGTTGQLLRLGIPLIVSHISVMLMQLVDVALLARYSPVAMAAAGFAGMLFFVMGGFFVAVAGFAGTFAAQYHGEGRTERIGPVIWQGVYLSVFFGVAMTAAGLATDAIFAHVSHTPELRAAEAEYFRWLCLGGVFSPLSACLTGFYAARGHNQPILAAQLAGALVNAGLDALLIFGLWGFPEMGVTGAAVATVIGQATVALLLGTGFFARGNRTGFATWSGRGWDRALALRLLRFGLPQGFRCMVEVALWAIFLFLIGKVGAMELASSQLAFRVNQLAFMPIVGFSMALTMLVGQAQGARRPDLARRAVKRGLFMAEAWMVVAATAFVVVPRWILLPLMGDLGDGAERISPEEYRAVLDTAAVLLRFVAVYVLADGFGIIFVSALQGAGDTWWTMKASVAAHVLAIAVFWLLGENLMAQWTAATAFIVLMALLWGWRLHGGRWETMRVTEATPEERRVTAESVRLKSRVIPE